MGCVDKLGAVFFLVSLLLSGGTAGYRIYYGTEVLNITSGFAHLNRCMIPLRSFATGAFILGATLVLLWLIRVIVLIHSKLHDEDFGIPEAQRSPAGLFLDALSSLVEAIHPCIFVLYFYEGYGIPQTNEGLILASLTASAAYLKLGYTFFFKRKEYAKQLEGIKQKWIQYTCVAALLITAVLASATWGLYDQHLAKPMPDVAAFDVITFPGLNKSPNPYMLEDLGAFTSLFDTAVRRDRPILQLL